MNNVHDLGGMMGFGPVIPEDDEPNFHADWERRVFALVMGGSGAFGPIDTFRHAIERMGAVNYLKTTYYEHWLAGLEILSAEQNLQAREKSDEPLTPEIIDAVVKSGIPSHREEGPKAKYAVGDKVRARNMHTKGHTRLPRYARGRVGTIELLHGNHVFPDTAAHANGENPEPLYAVRFSAQELWGDTATAKDSFCVDLWQSYLEDV